MNRTTRRTRSPAGLRISTGRRRRGEAAARAEGRLLARLGALTAIIGILVAVAAIVVPVLTGTDPPYKTEEEIRDDATQWADVEPTGAGPWSMIVTAGGDAPEPLGLKVRSSPTADGIQIGSVPDRMFVVAVCRIDSGFDPFPGLYDHGSVWFGIRWPTLEPGTGFLNSTRTDPYIGYVWSGAVVPQGTNGNFPGC